MSISIYLDSILFIYFSKLSSEDIHINDKKHNVLNLHGSQRGCSPLTCDH